MRLVPLVSAACLAALAAPAACVTPDNVTPGSDGGGSDGTTARDDASLADGSVDAQSANDASGPDDAGALDSATADSAPVPRDPFRHTWPITADSPATSSYVIDADAGTVTDKVTGLTWARGLLQQSETSFDAGQTGYVGETVQASARAECAGATIGGLTGFRLPTMVELMTIIEMDRYNWNNSQAFQDTAYGDVYWADADDDGTPVVYDNHYAPWTFISFPFAPQGPWASASIRCVRAPYPVTAHAGPPAAGRYTMTGAGSAIDNVTKLEWQIGSSSAVQQYYEATAYCAGLGASDAGVDSGVDAGARPWRVPSLKEMVSIWSEADGGLEPSVFGAVTSNGYLWTSTLYWGNSVGQGPNIRFAWTGTSGAKHFYWEANQNLSFTRCVRDAP